MSLSTTTPTPAGASGSVPVGPSLSIFDPVYLGIDEVGHPVYLPVTFQNVILAGVPGAGKSSLLSNFLAHGALSTDCRLCLIDGKQVELGLWEECADVFVGPDQPHAIRTLQRLQTVMDNRYTYLRRQRRRKITRNDDFAVILLVIDEIAYFSATVGDKKSQELFSALLRDLVARGRAVGIPVLAATQRPSSDIIPTSLRDLFAWRIAGYCTTDASSDIILGHGWAARGFSANTMLSPTNQGSCLLISESGTPRKMKGAYLTDADITHVADYAAWTRTTRRDGLDEVAA